MYLAQPLHSIHFYIHDAVLREVASDHWLGDPGRITLWPCLGEVDPIVGNITRAASHALDEQEGNSQLLADCLARALASRLFIKSMGSPAASCRSGAVLDQAQQRRLREFVARIWPAP